ncbi:MAG: hypothetical protein V4858_20775 [Pseudomonadota bacterium]
MKNRIAACLLALACLPGLGIAQDKATVHAAEKVKESAWISDPAMGKMVQKMVDSRFMPFKVMGQKDAKDILSYKAFFRPFPANMDKFFVYWGMTAEWYKARKDGMQQEGYQEIWHHTFRDAANTELHQAIWQKTLTTEQKPVANSHVYNDEEHAQNILMGMLWRSEFKKLDQTLDAAFAQKATGKLKSNVLQARFASLSRLDSDFQKQFDRWVKESGSGNAYLARGMFLNVLAWDARGEKYISETSKDKIAEFRRLSALARVDLNKATDKLANCAMCAGELIHNNRALTLQKSDDTLLQTALQQDPSLWAPTISYFNALRPEWGGSFGQMETFIATVEQKIGDKALVEHLKSRLYFSRGMAIYKEDLEGARVWFEKGVNEQAYQLLVNELALIYTRKNNHKRAAELLENSMARGNEWDLYTLEALAQAYFNLGLTVKGETLMAKRNEAVRRFKNAE